MAEEQGSLQVRAAAGQRAGWGPRPWLASFLCAQHPLWPGRGRRRRATPWLGCSRPWGWRGRGPTSLDGVLQFLMLGLQLGKDTPSTQVLLEFLPSPRKEPRALVLALALPGPHHPTRPPGLAPPPHRDVEGLSLLLLAPPPASLPSPRVRAGGLEGLGGQAGLEGVEHVAVF